MEVPVIATAKRKRQQPLSGSKASWRRARKRVLKNLGAATADTQTDVLAQTLAFMKDQDKRLKAIKASSQIGLLTAEVAKNKGAVKVR